MTEDAVRDSVLKIEDDNFEPATRKQRQLYCVAISAKRYALFLLDKNSETRIASSQLSLLRS